MSVLALALTPLLTAMPPMISLSSKLTGKQFKSKLPRLVLTRDGFREYKEALKQQRAHDVPSIYRTKEHEDQSYKTEPNTPTHQPAMQSMASSKSDPTPLNSAFSSPKHIFDDTSMTRKPVQKVQPSRNTSFSPGHSFSNGNSLEKPRLIHEYVKPKSPSKVSTGIMSHDNVPISSALPVILNGNFSEILGFFPVDIFEHAGKSMSPRLSTSGFVNGNGTPKGTNGMKTPRNISWTKETTEKMSFTMRREIDKAREETELIHQLRNVSNNALSFNEIYQVVFSIPDHRV